MVEHARRRAFVATLLVASGLLIGGCGSSSNSGSAGTASLTRAADLSIRAAGYRTTMDMQESVAGTTVSMTGKGSFDARSGEGAMVVRLSTQGQSYAVRAVFTRGTYYMKFPLRIRSLLGARTPWLSFSLNEIGKYEKVPGLGSLINSESSERNPSQFLDYTKATSRGSVKDLGQAMVDGVETTHYQASLDLSKLPGSVPMADRSAARQLVAVLRERYHASYSPVDVWIDQAGLIRKVGFSYSATIQGHSLSATITQLFTAYGPQPAPHIPGANENTDMLTFLRDRGTNLIAG